MVACRKSAMWQTEFDRVQLKVERKDTFATKCTFSPFPLQKHTIKISAFTQMLISTKKDEKTRMTVVD